jgi:glycosyltransferase involved in cell wall biosynthesis
MTLSAHSPSGTSLTVVHVVVTDGFAGAERYVVQVATELHRRGHRVLTLGGDPARMGAELPDGVTNRPAAHLVSAAAALATAGRVDLVHVHMTAAEGAAWLARPIHRAPVVATRHFAQRRGSSPLARTLARVTSGVVRQDIAISRFVAESIGGPSVVIPNGVPDRPQAPLEAPTVVMLQRLDTEKATDVGIRAFARSGLAGEGWRLVVAGEGVLRPSLAQLVETLDVSGHVELVGHVARTDQLLAGASVLLAPAPREPFGLSVVEAMAHGLPVVAAGGGAHLETVGADGLLFTPGDPGAAAGSLARLGADPGLRRSVGHALRRRQQERFTLSLHVDRLEQLYGSIVDGSRRPPSVDHPVDGQLDHPLDDPVGRPLDDSVGA